MKKPSLVDIKKAMNNVQAVHSCASCMAHLEAIKTHKEKGHPQ
jgi:hypothetical protein